MHLVRIALVALALAVPALSGCGADEPDPPPPEPKFELSVDDGEFRMRGQTEGGESFGVEFGGDVEAPELPDDVPLYPGVTPKGHLAASGKGTIATFETGDATGDVHAFYRRVLPRHGWELETSANLGDQRVVSAVKGERRVSVAITGRGGESQVTLSVTGGS